MNYCKHCQCNSCQSIRLVNSPEVKAKGEALRLIRKAGDEGMTPAELCRYSRLFRVFDVSERESILDTLVMDGSIMLHTFKPQSGRGKSRNAYLAVSQ